MTLKFKGCYYLCLVAIFLIPALFSNLQATENSFCYESDNLFQYVEINQNSYSTSSSVYQNASSLISVSPTPVSTWSGCSVVFSVETIGPVDSYQWEVSGDNGITWVLAGSNESTISVVDVTPAMDQHLYRCRVSQNGAEEASLSARLTVIAAPEVYAGPDQSICGNGAQNRLVVELQGSTTASSFSWEVINGEGQLLDEETLSPSYRVNPNDVGKEVVFRLSVIEPNGGACVLADEMALMVRDSPLFDVLLGVDDQPVSFDQNYSSVNLLNRFDAVSIRTDDDNPDLQHQNFMGDNVLIKSSMGENAKSRALFQFSFKDLPLGEDLSQSYLYIYTTQAGTIGENVKEILELYRISEEWDPESVTWANQPDIIGDKIHPISMSELEYDIPECEEGRCIQTRKTYMFNINEVVSEWYSGDMPNQGLLLKLAEDIDSDITLEFNSTSYDRIRANVYSTPSEILYLCKNQELQVTPVSTLGASLSYQWSGAGLVLEEEGAVSVLSHQATNHLSSNRTYILKGTFNDCSSSLYFYTGPTPVVTVPQNVIVTGSLTQQVSHRVSASVRNLPGLISWRKINGEGTIVNNDRIQPIYQAEISDFGTTITLEVSVNSAKESCNPEVRTSTFHILRPLHPYAGEHVNACSGQAITLEQAQLAKVPGVIDPSDQAVLDDIAEGYVSEFYWTHNGQGDFDNPNLLNPTYIPNVNGDNNVVICTLHVTDGDSMRASTVTSTMQINYTPKPVIVHGNYGAMHVGEKIVFDKSIISHTNRQEWTHNGNGIFTNNPGEEPCYSPVISDLSNENQSVVFTVRAWNACDDENEASFVLSILPPTNASAGEDVSICFGEEVQMGAHGGSQYIWSPEVGLSDPSIANPIARPSTTTLYTVIIIREYEGVEYTVSDQVLVNVNSRPEANAGVDRVVCPNTSISLTANSGVFDSRLKYEWFVGDELVAELQSPSFIVEQSKTFRLKVTGESGCSSEDQVSVQTTFGEPNIQISYPDCSGRTVQVAVSDFESVSWQPAASFACPLCANTTIINPDPDQIYVVSGIAGGCVIEKEFLLSEKPGPVITGLDYYEICPGIPVEFNLSAQSTGYSYSWEPTEGLSSSTVLNPVAAPIETSGYTLKATDGAGCVSETEVLVRVVKMPELNLSGALEICRGSSIDYRINRQNASRVEWKPAEGLSNPQGFFTTLSPDFNTTYTITVSNGSCEVSGNLEVKVLEDVDARFSYSYPGLSVLFTPMIGEGVTYNWDFGDGQTLNSPEPTVIHTYSNEGDYPVCLRISGSCGTYEHCATVKVSTSDSVNCD